MLGRARGGRGGGTALRGEAGIGKSTLLDYACEQATGMRVLRTSGVEPESDLGYASLHRLLLPVLDGIDRLPEPQARGLGVAFGRAAGPPPDRFLVALATLSLLSELASEQPLLCLVDDAHWADKPSLDALAFVARRLQDEPIALLFAARADEGWPLRSAGLTDLPIAGLDRESARALLVEHTGARLAASQQDALLRATGGNPLAIRELPATAMRDAGEGEPVPLADGLQREFLERARRHDPAAQRLLLLIAAAGTGRRDVLRRAAAGVGPAEPATLDQLDDLVTTNGSTVAFRHPLIRSAVYHGASPAQRRAAHAALAQALEGEPDEADRRAAHLGHAADGPDEQVAEELERSAERTLHRAGPAAAAAALGRAATLSTTPTSRARRLVAAAAAWWQDGDASRAAELLNDAERGETQPSAVRQDIAWLRALMELRAGVPGDAVALLRPMITDVLRADLHQAIRLLMLFGEASFHANAADVWAEVAAAAERLTLTGDDVDVVLARMFRGACRVRAGRDAGTAPGDLDVIEQLRDPAQLCWAGGMATGLGHPEVSRRLHHRAVRLARASGAAGTLAWTVQFLVLDDLNRGRFESAEAYAEEGQRFAAETGQPNLACWYQGSLALLAALRGQEPDARRLADAVLGEASTRHLAAAAALGHRALGLLELAAGRAAVAVEHLLAPARGTASAHPGIALRGVPDLVEAAVRAGQPERASEPLGRFTRWAEATGSPQLGALAARCRALLATSDTAELEFDQALATHALADWPMEQARTELLLGQHLRRERRRSDSRPHLRAAFETFQRLGAATWADRARAELRAAGESPTESTAPGTLLAAGTLTAQELRIATAVGEGSTNREIAAQLFLSQRTVDYHLRKVFQKLGISSRTELVRLAVDRGPSGDG